MGGTILTRLDAVLCRASDRAFGPARAGTLAALSATDVATLAAFGAAMASLGSWPAAALGCVVFASRAPWSLARLRADLLRGRGTGRARTDRAGQASRRRGALGLLATFAALATVAVLAGPWLDPAGEAEAFGIEPGALSAWKLAALPASTLADAVRMYAGCALPPVSAGRSRSGASA